MALIIETEVKLESEPCMLAWDGKLFVGTEDGSIKSFDANLNPEKSWPAHAVQLFALAAGGGKVYSSSNDGAVRVWTADGQKIAEIPVEVDVAAMTLKGNDFLTGDEDGNVVVYENNIWMAKYNVLEEVKGLQYRPPYIYTVRDLDVTVTEIKPAKSDSLFITRHTMEGTAPIQIHGNWLLVTARGGHSLRLHNANVEKEFKLMHEVKVSDMIITSLAVGGDFVWTAGWDGHIRRWKIENDQLKEAGTIDLGSSCVNALKADSNHVYAAVAGGRLLKVKAA